MSDTVDPGTTPDEPESNVNAENGRPAPPDEGKVPEPPDTIADPGVDGGVDAPNEGPGDADT